MKKTALPLLRALLLTAALLCLGALPANAQPGMFLSGSGIGFPLSPFLFSFFPDSRGPFGAAAPHSLSDVPCLTLKNGANAFASEFPASELDALRASPDSMSIGRAGSGPAGPQLAGAPSGKRQDKTAHRGGSAKIPLWLKPSPSVASWLRLHAECCPDNHAGGRGIPGKRPNDPRAAPRPCNEGRISAA